MKLNENEKNILRATIEKKLQVVPIGERIKIRKDILEEILFESFEVFNINGSGKLEYGKRIVWSGPFLSKIDLSEMSFDGVLWDNEYTFEDRIRKLDMEQWEIDLSNTNAKIDFSKSFDVDSYWPFRCNFENVDLSNTTIMQAQDSNFSNTGIKINVDKVVEGMDSTAYDSFFGECNLSGLDFSSYTIGADVLYCDQLCSGIHETDLSNTGLHIIIPDDADEGTLESIKQLLMEGKLVGCFINGKEVRFKNKITNDENNINDLVSSTLNDIETQTETFRRK